MTRPGGRLQEPQTASLRRPLLSHSDWNSTKHLLNKRATESQPFKTLRGCGSFLGWHCAPRAPTPHPPKAAPHHAAREVRKVNNATRRLNFLEFPSFPL